MLTETQRSEYQRDGYFVARGLFTPEEVAQYIAHFTALRAAGTYWGDYPEPDPGSPDPWKRFPRMIHMHRWDDLSLRWMLDPRLNACLTALLGREPYAVQTMLYFKPPGGRGQALHQDQFYLRVQPGTCMAAWLALDACDEENGCMQVVPGSHDLPVLCTTQADTRVSITDITVPLAEGMNSAPVRMEPGDVLFFNGSVIHGSLPNVSKDRFRRALIGHYIAGEAEKVGQFFHPVLRMDGTEATLGAGEAGGPCGIWREIGGEPRVEMVAPVPAAAGAARHE